MGRLKLKGLHVQSGMGEEVHTHCFIVGVVLAGARKLHLAVDVPNTLPIDIE